MVVAADRVETSLIRATAFACRHKNKLCVIDRREHEWQRVPSDF